MSEKQLTDADQAAVDNKDASDEPQTPQAENGEAPPVEGEPAATKEE